MIFSAHTRKVGGTVIVDMSGRLTMGEPALLLRNTIRRFIADGNTKFILNMAEVSNIDSGGLGELVAAYTTVKNSGGDIKLLKLAAKAKDLMQMTKLLTIFDSYDDEQKAVAALSSAAAHG
jgi:anti-sigma B factor antagonist